MRAALILLVLAASGGQSATQALQKRDREIRAVLPPAGKKPSARQLHKAEDMLTRIIDFEGMAKAALGKFWGPMKPAKRKELLDAFSARFKQASSTQVDFYRSTHITYHPEQKQDGEVKVPTSMVVKGEPTDVAYVMKKGRHGWQIEDIIIDDVSTIEDYRSSFTAVINKEGIDGLIARLKKGQKSAAAPKKAGAKRAHKARAHHRASKR